jgi:hypothetical protein
MDTATGLVFHLVGRFDRLTPASGVRVVTALTAALAGGVLVVGHLLPASEPLIVAPLRWIGA